MNCSKAAQSSRVIAAYPSCLSLGIRGLACVFKYDPRFSEIQTETLPLLGFLRLDQRKDVRDLAKLTNDADRRPPRKTLPTREYGRCSSKRAQVAIFLNRAARLPLVPYPECEFVGSGCRKTIRPLTTVNALQAAGPRVNALGRIRSPG